MNTEHVETVLLAIANGAYQRDKIAATVGINAQHVEAAIEHLRAGAFLIEVGDTVSLTLAGRAFADALAARGAEV